MEIFRVQDGILHHLTNALFVKPYRCTRPSPWIAHRSLLMWASYDVSYLVPCRIQQVSDHIFCFFKFRSVSVLAPFYSLLTTIGRGGWSQVNARNDFFQRIWTHRTRRTAGTTDVLLVLARQGLTG